MADRNDDIKQLFSHLGLNPGDYQEIREKSRAAPRGESLMPAPPAVAPVVTAPAPTVQVAPPAAAMPAPAEAVTIAKPSIRVAPTVAPIVNPPPPVAAAPVTAPISADATARWSLLRAAVETPTRVAQIERTAASTVPIQPIQQELPPLEISEEQPTRRLFQELSRRPVDETVGQLTEAARRRWQEPAPAVEAPAPAPQYEEAPQPPAYAAATEPETQEPEITGSGELLSTFRRLVAPERVPQQKPARLRFNYTADATAPRAKQPREENLGDVFSRISDPRFPR
jgi:hypothetical protein